MKRGRRKKENPHPRETSFSRLTFKGRRLQGKCGFSVELLVA